MKPFVSIRIVNIDHYLTEPGPYDSQYCAFSDAPLKKVPVIRIFGSTPGGQKACLHIHQIYPYLYIPYTLSTNDQQQIQHDIYRFGVSLNTAIRLSYDKGNQDEQHIAAIVMVKGVPFYGYHVEHGTFLKIYYMRPSEKYRIVEILQKCAIRNTFYQPHEAHLSFELQFLMDYNLFGMDWIRLLAYNLDEHKNGASHTNHEDGGLSLGTRFRQPMMSQTKSLYLSSTTSSTSSSSSTTATQRETVYTSETVPSHLKWDGMERTSFCELEIDTTVMMILNRLDVKERDIHADLDKEAKQETTYTNETEEKLVKSLDEIWKDERRRRQTRGMSLSSLTSTGDKEASSNIKGGTHEPWSTECQLRSMIRRMVEREGTASYQRTQQDDPGVMTAFQAVEALYSKDYHNFIMSKRNKEEMSVEQRRSSTPLFSEDSGSPPINRVNTPTDYQQSILATPSRFRSINASATPNVDENIIELLRQSQSFLEGDDEHNDDNGNSYRMKDEEEMDKQNGDAIEEQKYSKTENEGTHSIHRWDDLDDEFLKWSQQVEKKDPESSTSATVKIDYDDDEYMDPFPIRPRELDFSAVSSSEANESTGPHPARSVDMEDLGLTPLNVSELPPSLPVRLGRKRKRRVIPQNDGANDEDNDDRDDANEDSDDTLYQMMNRRNRRRKMDQYQFGGFHKRFRLSTGSHKIFSHISLPTHTLTKHQLQQDISPADSPSMFSMFEDNIVEEYDPSASTDGIANTTIATTAIGDDNTKLARTNSSSENSTGTSQPECFSKDKIGLWSPRSDTEEQSAYTSFWLDPPQATSPPRQPSEEAQKAPLNKKLETPTGERNVGSYNTVPDKEKQKPKGTQAELLSETQPPVQPTLPLHTVTPSGSNKSYFMFGIPPPVIDSAGRTEVLYQEPYYSKVEDVPSVARVFSGKEYKPISYATTHLKPFDTVPCNGRQFYSSYREQDIDEWRQLTTSIRVWSPASDPPSYNQVLEWMKAKSHSKDQPKKAPNVHTQINCSTAKNTYDFKYNLSKPKSKVTRIREYLDLFSLEIHVNTNGKLMPDPSQNAVQAIFWCLKTEDENVPKSNGYDASYRLGIITLDHFNVSKIGITGVDVIQLPQEQDLLWALVDKVRSFDPDILVGYELHNSSWGYLIERALAYNINLMDELSRVYCESQRLHHDRWGYQKASAFRVTGRHMLNVWRLMRSEVDLTSYKFENIAYNVLHRRVPHYSFDTLTSWYTKGTAVLKHRLFRYYLERVQMNLDLLDISEIINKVSESARVFGIDFFSVITRGSQFKVESIMFRIGKPENFIMISPSRKQVAEQRAIECLPLVMEPISQYYSSPLLVLDFQSLYPSIMIAYNYCFSTCVGKITGADEVTKRLGVTEFDMSEGLLGTVENQLNVSPNGVAFVKPSIRKSLLAKMLSEILETRVMVKNAMKDYEHDTGLLRLLNARQLTLKYVANVTYGYTSASFSGRMPCVEIADSIVQTARETLERTIKLINEHATWGAKVVYGDTDSVFVYLPGKSRMEAFAIGEDIASVVTGSNPAPMKLKFEKVYHPCLLIAKKRYVGYKYEHRDQGEPEFEAKGIETVRRDGTAATQKILEYCIKILFKSQDLSKVKEYLYDQWTKILSNRVSVQDFIIAKEVRLGTYRSLPHGAQVAQAEMMKDPRAEPQYGERVPYVVVNQGPNARLKDRVAKPELLLHDRSLRLDGEYYIRKQIIAPLERVFKLVGADVSAWYDEMPRARKAMALSLAQPREIHEKSMNRIDQYYASSHCVVCSQLASKVVCDDCLGRRSQSAYILLSRQKQTQKKLESTLLICQHCSGTTLADFATASDDLAIGNTGYMNMPCDSLDCPMFYERTKACHDVYGSATYDALIERLGQEEDLIE